LSAFADLPISYKLVAAFAAVIVVISASSAIVYNRLLVIDFVRNARVHSRDVSDTRQRLLDALVDQETGVRGYLITGNHKFLEPYRKGLTDFNAALQKAKDLTQNNPHQQRRFNELNDLAKKWQSTIAEREIALMADPDNREQARAVEASGTGKTQMDLIRAKNAEIEGVERHNLAKLAVKQERAFTTAYRTILFGGVTSLIIALLMGVWLMRSITVPMAHITSALTKLSKGDLSVKIPGGTRGDEVGALAEAAQIFKDKMISREKTQAELARVVRLSTMGELVASIAHEIKQPLSGIMTHAEAGLRWLNRDKPNLNETRDSMSFIEQDSKRAAKMIDNLRALTKKSELQFEKLDIHGAIEEVLALTRGELRDHQIDVETNLAVSDPMVIGDRVQVQQVVLNLIMNAIDAMSAVHDWSKVLTICSEPSDSDGVLIKVKDTGLGIDQAIADRIFNSFFTTKPKGMGMGLAICRSIIEAHNGRLWASANTPHGAIFQLTLPTKATESTSAA
jgi:signal transduction histidine kinase